MERHRTDFVALLIGLVLLALGGGYIAHEASGGSLDPAWVLAIACSTVGVAFLAVTLVHRQERDGAPAPAVADRAVEPEGRHDV